MIRISVTASAVALASLLMLSACGDDKETATETSTPDKSTSAPGTQTSPPPAKDAAAPPVQPGQTGSETAKHEFSNVEQKINKELDSAVADAQAAAEEIKQEVASTLAAASDVKTSVENLFATLGQIPDSIDGPGMQTRGVGAAEEGAPSMTYQNRMIVIDVPARDGVDGGTVEVTPTADGDKLSWSCTGGTLPAELRPAECQ